MLIKYYRVTLRNDRARAVLLAENRPAHWDIAASDLPKAWAKFKRLYFAPIPRDLVNPADYDIHLQRTESR